MTRDLFGATALSTPAEVDAFLEAHPRAALFKAGGCSQTDWALAAVRRALGSVPGVPLGYLSVLDARAASNHVAARTGVQHQSPQILLFDRGSVVFHRDHNGVAEVALTEGLRQLTSASS